jgi:hypothetical protein
MVGIFACGRQSGVRAAVSSGFSQEALKRGDSPMTWFRTMSPKAKFLHALLKTKPIEVVYKRPSDIGIGCESLVKDKDRQLFKDFALFAKFLNGSFESLGSEFGGWRIQELDDTEIEDSPDPGCFGCRYDVFFNELKIGLLEIQAAWWFDDRDNLNDYTTDNPTVYADVELEYVRYLPFSYLCTFLQTLAKFVTTDDDTKIRALVSSELLAMIWPADQADELPDNDDWCPAVEPLEIRFEGSAINYIRSTVRRGSDR